MAHSIISSLISNKSSLVAPNSKIMELCTIVLHALHSPKRHTPKHTHTSVDNAALPSSNSRTKEKPCAQSPSHRSPRLVIFVNQRGRCAKGGQNPEEPKNGFALTETAATASAWWASTVRRQDHPTACHRRGAVAHESHVWVWVGQDPWCTRFMTTMAASCGCGVVRPLGMPPPCCAPVPPKAADSSLGPTCRQEDRGAPTD